jgi:hypothetical protein
MACYTLTSLFRVNEPYLVYNAALAKRMKLRKYALASELAVKRSCNGAVCGVHIRKGLIWVATTTWHLKK